MKKILISAGEASGDFYGAELAKRIYKLKRSKVKITGFGGAKMRSAGVDVRLDLVSHAAMGFWEVFVNLFTHLKLYFRAVSIMKKEKPDCLVVIDSPGYHMPLIKEAKKQGIGKVVYYSTPQVWVWKPERIRGLKKYTDLCVVVLPFEEKILKDAGINAKYFGHPIAPYLAPARPRAKEKLVGIFPGSRTNEIKTFFDLILRACALIRLNCPGARFVLFKAPTVPGALLMPYLEKYQGLKIKVVDGGDIKAKSSLCAAIAKSGTTTLELALMGVPMVIVYRISELSYLITRALAKGKYVGLPNIIAGREIVKEFIQHGFKAGNVSREVLRILKDEGYYRCMKKELAQFQAGRGKGKNVVQNVAKEIIREAGL